MVKDFEWQEVDYNRSNAAVAPDKLRLMKSSKDNSIANMLVIPQQIAEELCWEAGQTCTLYKNGNLFMLKAKAGGVETLRKASSGAKQLRITSVGMTSHMGLSPELLKGSKPIIFDAWTDDADDGAIIFKLAKGGDKQ